MKKEKKVFLTSESSFEDNVVQNLIEEGIDRVVFNISRSFADASKKNFFKNVRGLADENGKEVIIESIDDHILEMASLAGLKALNPVFRVRERAVSDIFPSSQKKPPSIPRDVRESKSEPEEEEDEEIKPHKEKRGIKVFFRRKKKEEKRADISEKEESSAKEAFVFVEPAKKRKKRISLGKKYVFVYAFAILILIAGAWYVIFKLPSAEINLFMRKASAEFSESVEITVDETMYSIKTPGKIILAGEVLTSTQNMQMTFKANGIEQAKEKARGILTVSNSFSSAPQIFVAMTRFESPSGKIFRVEKQITVPGSKVQNGKIIPSSIDIEVVADQPGDDYNLSPMSGWKIPGLKGTSKYNGFSAENKKPMSGGYVGEHLTATEEDKKSAEESVTTSLKDALSAQTLVLLSDSLKVPEEGVSFRITKKEYQYPKDDLEHFTIFAEGEMKQFAFDEGMLKEAIMEKAKKSLSGDIPMKATQFNVSYSAFQPDFDDGKMTVKVQGNILFMPDLDDETLKNELAGKTRSEMQRIIFSIPGLENAETSLEPKWAFWVNSVPQSKNRIFIGIE